MSEHPPADEPGDDGIPATWFLELGRLAVVSSTLDHTLNTLLVLCEGGHKYTRTNRSDTRKRLRAAVDWRVESGDLLSDDADFIVEWCRQTLALLGRRDVAIHAVWTLDPVTEQLFMSHIREQVPTLPELSELVRQSRLHMLLWTLPRQVVVASLPRTP